MTSHKCHSSLHACEHVSMQALLLLASEQLTSPLDLPVMGGTSLSTKACNIPASVIDGNLHFFNGNSLHNFKWIEYSKTRDSIVL